MIEQRNRYAGNTPTKLKAEGYISIVGLAQYIKNRSEAKKLRKAVEGSSHFHAILLHDGSGRNGKFWYRKDQVDDLLKYIRTGTPPAQGELFSGVDMGSPEGDKTVETTLNIAPEEVRAPVEEKTTIEPESVS